MAVTKSSLFADYDNNGNPADSILSCGRMRVINDTITLDGTETTGTVTLHSLPLGAKVDRTQSSFILTATTGMTVDLGTNGVADNLVDGVALTSAGTTVFAANAPTLVDVTTDGTVTLTFKSGTASATTIRVRIVYYIR